MHKDLQDELRARYPKIFPSVVNPPTSYGLYGIECEDGWFFLINDMCSQIQTHIDIYNRMNPTAGVPQFVCVQCKQKFGSLRMYYTGGDKYIMGVVDTYAMMSIKTCEECGTNQNVGNTRPWIYTLCEKHNKGGKLYPVVDQKLIELVESTRPKISIGNKQKRHMAEQFELGI